MRAEPRALAEFARLEMGQSPPSSSVSDVIERGLPFLQGNAEFGARHPTPTKACSTPLRRARPGDALISVRAPVGAINLADRDYCIGRGLAAITFTGIDSRFGVHALRFSAPALNRVAQGTTFDAVGRAELGALAILVPPLPEQRAIAAVLDTLDDAIQKTEQIIAKLKQVKQGLLHDLLTRGVDDNGELRDPERHPEQFQDSPLGRIPKGWRVVGLGDIATNHDGRRIPLKQGDRERRRGQYPYYGASGVIDTIDGFIFDGDFVLLGEDGENVVSRHLPLAFRATGRIWVNNHAHVYEPLSGTDVRFLVELLEATSFASLVSGSAQPKLTQEALGRLRFAMPPPSEQRTVGDLFEAHARRTEIEMRGAEKLRAMKAGLAEDLLTGRVRTTSLAEAAA
jgi:type I restriction enzyme S subunit